MAGASAIRLTTCLARDGEGSVAIVGQSDALILLSGGIDSATALALSLEQDVAQDCLFIDYGQAAAVAEAKASALIAAHYEFPTVRSGAAACDSDLARYLDATLSCCIWR